MVKKCVTHDYAGNHILYKLSNIKKACKLNHCSRELRRDCLSEDCIACTGAYVTLCNEIKVEPEYKPLNAGGIR
jgi:hypothetical protein